MFEIKQKGFTHIEWHHCPKTTGGNNIYSNTGDFIKFHAHSCNKFMSVKNTSFNATVLHLKLKHMANTSPITSQYQNVTMKHIWSDQWSGTWPVQLVHVCIN